MLATHAAAAASAFSDGQRLETHATAVDAGTVLYEKTWDDGQIDSGSWMHQAGDTLTGVVNGIVYGTISPSNKPANTGTKSGRFSVPANASYRQGAMMLHNRTVKNGSDEWFAMAYYFPKSWPKALTDAKGTRRGVSIGCPNYYSVNSCMVSVSARPRSMFTLINSGACPASGVSPGCPWYSATPDGGNFSRCRGFTGAQCGPLYIVRPGHLKLKVWHEIIMHVYYTLENKGVVQFWHRVKGQSSWRKAVSVSGGFPTLQTGPTAFDKTVTASNINDWPSTDQLGLYRGPAARPATLWADNWCRATSFDSAASCFSWAGP